MLVVAYRGPYASECPNSPQSIISLLSCGSHVWQFRLYEGNRSALINAAGLSHLRYLRSRTFYRYIREAGATFIRYSTKISFIWYREQRHESWWWWLSGLFHNNYMLICLSKTVASRMIIDQLGRCTQYNGSTLWIFCCWVRAAEIDCNLLVFFIKAVNLSYYLQRKNGNTSRMLRSLYRKWNHN